MATLNQSTTPLAFSSEGIRSRRKELGLTQVDLAARAGVAQSSITRLENEVGGDASATLKVLVALGLLGTPSDLETASAGVAERIEERLRQTGKNAHAVSREAGLGESAVRDIIRNRANPRIDTLKKLAGPLECDLSFLTGQLFPSAHRVDQPALTDLLGFLHFLRAERGIDVPERHFETLRSLTTTDQKAQT